MRTELRYAQGGSYITTVDVENVVACGLRPDDEVAIPGDDCYVVVKKHYTLISKPQIGTELVLFVKERY